MRLAAATDCEARVERLYKLIKKDEWEELTDFDPLFLHWVGHSESSISINRKAYEYVDIAYVVKNKSSVFHVYENKPEPRGIKLDRERGRYKLDLAVYCEEREPVKREFMITFEGEGIEKIGLEDIEGKAGIEPLPPVQPPTSPPGQNNQAAQIRDVSVQGTTRSGR